MIPSRWLTGARSSPGRETTRVRRVGSANSLAVLLHLFSLTINNNNQQQTTTNNKQQTTTNNNKQQQTTTDIFPGVALGILLAGARRVTDHHFLVAARSLAAQVTGEETRVGLLYPQLDRIRDVSPSSRVRSNRKDMIAPPTFEISNPQTLHTRSALVSAPRSSNTAGAREMRRQLASLSQRRELTRWWTGSRRASTCQEAGGGEKMSSHRALHIYILYRSSTVQEKQGVGR